MIEVKHSIKPVAYEAAMSWMDERVQAVIEERASECIWFLEHEPLYTAGRTALEQDLLEKHKLPVYHTNRGGKYTYHGPGQRIIYTMLDINRRHNGQPNIRLLIQQLENAVIQTLAEFGLKAYIHPEMVGIWIRHNGDERKIAAIGLHVKKWVTSHGVALNVHPNMEHFSGIVPCGLHNFTATSMKELGVCVEMEKVDLVLREKLATILAVNFLNSKEVDDE